MQFGAEDSTSGNGLWSKQLAIWRAAIWDRRERLRCVLTCFLWCVASHPDVIAFKRTCLPFVRAARVGTTSLRLPGMAMGFRVGNDKVPPIVNIQTRNLLTHAHES